MHFPEGGKMQISQKLELYRANQYQIRNQRPRLRRNTLFLGRKAGVAMHLGVFHKHFRKFSRQFTAL